MPNEPDHDPEEVPADPAEGPEVREAFDRLNRRMRHIAAQIVPEEARRAMREIDELREAEGHLDSVKHGE